MMSTKLPVTFVLAGLCVMAGCAGDQVSARRQSIQSCFDTGAGMQCAATPGAPSTTPTDVDRNGTTDPFVCADSDEDHDGMIDANDDDDDGDGVADAEDGDDGDAEDAVSGADDDGADDHDHDGISDDDDEDDDDDGVDDSIDCDDHDDSDDAREAHDD